MPLAARLPLVAFAVSVLAAQEVRPLVGKVVDSDGAPVAGAEVVLGALTHVDLELAESVVVRATTDERGGFRAPLRSDLGYAGFAIGPADKGGSRLVSGVQLDLLAAQSATLRATHRVVPRVLHCTGLAAWGDEAPRRCRVLLSHAPAAAFEFALAADGTATLAPMPVDGAHFELLDRDGAVLLSVHATTDAASLELPPPKQLTFHVADEQGKAIAGASIDQRSASPSFDHLGTLQNCSGARWRRLGVTGADGVLTARVAGNRPKGQVISPAADWIRVFRATAKGRADGITGFLDIPGPIEIVDARRDRGADRSQLHFELPPAQPLRGGVLAASDRPLADTELAVSVVRQLPLNNRGAVDVRLLYRTRTDAHGAWGVDAAPAGFVQPMLLAPPGLRDPRGLLLPAVLDEREGHVERLGPVRLDQLRGLDLKVLRPDGGPAEGAVVVLMPLVRRLRSDETYEPRARLDRAGSARLGLPAGDCLLFCTDGSNAAHAVLRGDPRRLELRLQPLPSTTVHVVDAQGRPAPGARLCLDVYGTGQERPPEAKALEAVAVSLIVRGLDDVWADREGVVRLPYLDGVELGLELHFEHAGMRSAAIAPGAAVELTATLNEKLPAK